MSYFRFGHQDFSLSVLGTARSKVVYSSSPHWLISQQEEEKKNTPFTLRETRPFHVTRQAEIWPIILGAGVAYMGLKFFQNYYADICK